MTLCENAMNVVNPMEIVDITATDKDASDTGSLQSDANFKKPKRRPEVALGFKEDVDAWQIFKVHPFLHTPSDVD